VVLLPLLVGPNLWQLERPCSLSEADLAWLPLVVKILGLTDKLGALTLDEAVNMAVEVDGKLVLDVLLLLLVHVRPVNNHLLDHLAGRLVRRGEELLLGSVVHPSGLVDLGQLFCLAPFLCGRLGVFALVAVDATQLSTVLLLLEHLLEAVGSSQHMLHHHGVSVVNRVALLS